MSQPMRKLFLLAIGAAIAIACGSSDSSPATGSTDDGGAPADGSGIDGAVPPGDDAGTDGGGVCGPAVCGSAGACGSVKDACGATVDCGLCKYDADTVTTGSSAAIAVVPGASPLVAYGNQLATRGAGSWTSAPFAAVTIGTVSMAVATDGTPWIAYTDKNNGGLTIAHRDAGAWVPETPPNHAPYSSGALALAPDGTPWALYPGVGNTILLAKRVSGTWQTTPVTTTTKQVQNVAMVFLGADPQLLWHDTALGVMYAHGTTAPFTTEQADPAAIGSEPDGITIGYGLDQLDAAVTGAGELHVAYRAGDVKHAVRAGGTWTAEKIPRLSFFSQFEDGPVQIAASSTGAVAIATLGSTISVLSRVGTTWSEQPVVPRCSRSNDRLDVAYDATGALVLAHTCRGNISYLVQHGTYPADYPTACKAILDGLCAQACTCPKDTTNKCCIIQSGSICVDPAPNCQSELLADRPPCANATLDPSVAYGCRDALATTTTPTCEPPDASKPGMDLPAACAALY